MVMASWRRGFAEPCTAISGRPGAHALSVASLMSARGWLQGREDTVGESARVQRGQSETARPDPHAPEGETRCILDQVGSAPAEQVLGNLIRWPCQRGDEGEEDQVRQYLTGSPAAPGRPVAPP